MGRIRDALEVLRGAPEPAIEVKEAPGAELVVSTSEVGRPVIEPYSWDFMRRLYLTANSTVAACGDFWARNLSEPPIGVLDVDGAMDLTHPLARVFASPNPFYSQDELWQAVVYQLCQSDHGAFLLAPLNNAGEPIALWPKSADEVRIIPSRSDFVGRYEVRVGTDTWQPIDPTKVAVVWFRLIHPDDKWRSYPPVEKVRREIRTEANIGRWLDYALQNMGSLSALVGVEHPDVDQAATNAIRDYMNEALSGAHNAKKIGVVSGKVTAREFGVKFGELDFGPLQDRLEVASARAFGIAPELVHTLATSTAGSGLGGERQRELKAAAYEDTLIPISKMLAAKVASVFAPVYGISPEQVVFDFSGVQALADDTTAAVQRARDAREFWTVDECRAETGRPPCDDPVVGGQIVAIATRPNPTAGSYTDAPVKSLEDKATAAQSALRATVDTKARDLEPAFAAVARAAFGKQRDRILGAAKSAAGLERKDSYDALLGSLDDFEDPDDWAGLYDVVSDAFKEGASVHETALRGTTLQLQNPRTAAAVQKRVTKITGNVDTTTIDRIREVVTAGRESGASLKETVSGIERVFEAADGWRAEMIARTESIGAANQGGFELAREAESDGLGVVKTWISFADERTRESHILVDGEDADMSEPFSNGLMYPGDEDGDADEVINCRCSCGYSAGGPGPDTITS